MMIQVEPAERINSPHTIVAVARTLPPAFLIPRHNHTTGRLIYSAEGTMTIETSSNAYAVPPTRALWVPPGITHSVRSAGQVELRSLDFAEPAIRDFPSTCEVISVSPLLREIILRLAESGMSYPLGSYPARIAALVPEEVARARRLPLGLPLPKDSRLRRLCTVLLDNPADTRLLAAFGRTAGASARTLTRLFRAETGMSFVQWRQQARLFRALALLAEGCSVTEAALIVGYETPSAFIRLHRRLLGTTPTRGPFKERDVS